MGDINEGNLQPLLSNKAFMDLINNIYERLDAEDLIENPAKCRYFNKNSEDWVGMDHEPVEDPYGNRSTLTTDLIMVKLFIW